MTSWSLNQWWHQKKYIVDVLQPKIIAPIFVVNDEANFQLTPLLTVNFLLFSAYINSQPLADKNNGNIAWHKWSFWCNLASLLTFCSLDQIHPRWLWIANLIFSLHQTLIVNYQPDFYPTSTMIAMAVNYYFAAADIYGWFLTILTDIVNMIVSLHQMLVMDSYTDLPYISIASLLDVNLWAAASKWNLSTKLNLKAKSKTKIYKTFSF